MPHSPGVYRYYDSAGNVIYVGKAKDLNKRVAQYFVPEDRLTLKTRVLVSKIADVQYTVVDSEADALLLENNLIKQFKPRYNILLKDSKTYPWICVTGETYPRVFLTRRLVRNGSRYFGPYSSVRHARHLLDFIEENYKLRSCRHKIDSDTILRGKIRPCLDFQMHRCGGCCVGAVSVQKYESDIAEIISLLKGGVGELIRDCRNKMLAAADRLDFEQAQLLKDKLETLQRHYAKTIISTERDVDADVFSLDFDGAEAFGNFLRVRSGAIVQSLNLGFKMNIEEAPSTVLSMFIGEIEAKFGNLSKEVVVPFMPDVEIPGISFVIPVRGDKLQMLGLSLKNAKEFHLNSLLQREHSDPEAFHLSVMEDLRASLGMKVLPVHMECFDNSNTQGTDPVASCVVFRNAVPSKKDYRRFKIKTVVGANDFASMKEVVNRRYARMLAENPEDLPQLVIIDGGKGQLDFAYQALAELGLTDRITIIGLAKRLEEVVRIGDPYPLFIDRNSQALKLLQQIRDEAHRFGITFHRSLRDKSGLHSTLREIKGVGEKTEQRLLMHFGSVARISAAPLEEIAALTGPSLAQAIQDKLNNIS